MDRLGQLSDLTLRLLDRIGLPIIGNHRCELAEVEPEQQHPDAVRLDFLDGMGAHLWSKLFHSSKPAREWVDAAIEAMRESVGDSD